MAVVLVGNPNVGKSAVYNRLTGSNAFISNFPGTSVELSQANLVLGGKNISIYDTPGVYSIFSPEEGVQVVRTLLNQGNIDLVINVVDATNLERSLVLTYELLELNLPLVLVVNQIDLARDMAIEIKDNTLARILNKPVVPFSATTGEGLLELLKIIENKTDKAGIADSESDVIVVNTSCAGNCANCFIPEDNCTSTADFARAEKARTAAAIVVERTGESRKMRLEKMQTIIDHPFIGTVLLLCFAYLGFVVLLKFIELSEGPIATLLQPVNLAVADFITAILPPGMVTMVLSKAIPEGLVIPFTIIMPAMFMVSLIMSILEDTGLLPRYSVALERIGSFFGVSGQAIIPISLGFGCRTPAVVATRILPTAAQRFIVITLLSIVIPCAATTGILASVIAVFQASLPVIVATMLITLMVLGIILSRIMPREDLFIYELPPLRIPLWRNVWSKIKMRFTGFFTEVLPLLLVMSIAVRAIIESGLLATFNTMEGFTRAFFGIPAEAFVAVLVTIFQRYLAPLVLLNIALTPREATIAIAMIALSLPCLPVMVMIVRETGVKSLIKILGLGFATSFCVGIILNLVLPV